MSIEIRKLDIDTIGSEGPPTWGKMRAIINGVDVQLTLDPEQIGRALAAAYPVAFEMLARLKNPSSTVVEIKREPAS